MRTTTTKTREVKKRIERKKVKEEKLDLCYQEVHGILTIRSKEGVCPQEEAKIMEPETIHSERSFRPIKILSDIDDTMISSGGAVGCADKRYPWGTVYPGVRAFYRELDLGSNLQEIVPESSNLIFVTARPDMIEERTYEKFKTTDLHTRCIILTGLLRDGIKTVWGDYESMAATKIANFLRVSQIYPEYKYVFIGDNGQGDYLVAKKMCTEYPNIVLEAFIHHVWPIEKMVGYLEQDFKKPNPNIHFFTTYVGAGLEAFNSGLISQAGLLRIVEAAKQDFEKIEHEIMTEMLPLTASQKSSWNLLGSRSPSSSKVSATIESLLANKIEQNKDISKVANLFGIKIDPIL